MAAEFYPENGSCLGWKGIVSFTLEEIHPVESKSFDFDYGFPLLGNWFGDIFGDVWRVFELVSHS